MKTGLFLFACTATLVQNGGAARILALLGMPSPSHHIVIRSLLEELAHRGHNIVSMTTNPVSYPKDFFKGTFKVIDVQNASYSLWYDKVNRTNFYSKYAGNYKIYHAHLSTLPALVDVQLEEPEIKRIIKDQHESFDLVIVQNMVPIYYAAAARFNAPLVAFTCGVGSNYDYKFIGMSIHPLFYTDFSNRNIVNINFLSKLEVLQFSFWMDFTLWSRLPDLNKAMKKHFGFNVPSLEEILDTASFTLSSMYPEIHGIRPNVPSLVHTSGIQLKPREELPLELKEYLDKSSNGVIYMSFGTITKSSSLPLDTIMMFNKVFSRLPYNFIWKWNGEEYPGKSANILLAKWVPQQDLLGHPNVKAFITHAGMNSIDEAIYNQVPVISIPFITDQFRNAKVAENMGIGIALDYNSLTEDILFNAINKVTKNPSYRSNIQHLSLAVQDKPRSGLELAVWWVEYVIRHNGTEHLRAPTMDLYEYLMLDVIALVLVTILVPVFFVYKTLY